MSATSPVCTAFIVALWPFSSRHLAIIRICTDGTLLLTPAANSNTPYKCWVIYHIRIIIHHSPNNETILVSFYSPSLFECFPLPLTLCAYKRDALRTRHRFVCTFKRFKHRLLISKNASLNNTVNVAAQKFLQWEVLPEPMVRYTRIFVVVSPNLLRP